MDETTNGAVGTEFKPPYLSFLTFWNFLLALAAKPLPPQIDRSMMDSKSGTDQTYLFAALRAFDFITETNAVLPLLRDFAEGDEAMRKLILSKLVREKYAPAIEVSDNNGTAKQLQEVFSTEWDLSGDTLRKATTFFLHAARSVGMELSPHFPQTRAGSGAPSTPRKRAAKKKPVEPTPQTYQAPPTASGDSYVVKLTSGGSVTLTVEASHFALSKVKADREFVFGLVDALTAYAEANGSEVTATGDGEDEGDG